MFKPILFSSILFAQTVSMASGVKILSFRYLESGTRNSPAAELCGELVAVTGKPELIKVTADPNSKTPAPYYTWTGKNGRFCLVLATFTGQANAEVE